MRIWLLCLLFTACAFAGCNNPQKQMNDELAKLQGKWFMISTTALGKTITVEEESKMSEITLEFVGNTYKEGVAGKFTIDPKRSPKWIDKTPDEGNLAGRTQLGIYGIENEQLTICWSVPSKLRRPRTFTPEEGELKFIYKKVAE